MNRILGERRLAGLHSAVLVESECRDAAIRSDELILFANRLAQPLDLDLASLLGQFVRMYKIPFPSMQRLEQSGREAP